MGCTCCYTCTAFICDILLNKEEYWYVPAPVGLNVLAKRTKMLNPRNVSESSATKPTGTCYWSNKCVIDAIIAAAGTRFTPI